MGAVLVLLYIYTEAGQYFGRTWSLWLASISFLASPFWFNPLTFDWKVVTSDYAAYTKWLRGTSGGSSKSWSIWWNEDNAVYAKLPLTSKLVYFPKMIVYVVLANGIRVSDLFSVDMSLNTPEISISYLLVLIVSLLVFSKIFVASENHLSYTARRFISLILFTGITFGTVTILVEDLNFLRYVMSAYYYLSAFCLLGLLFGVKFVKNFYLIHDLLCAHIIFIPLFVLAAFQIPSYIQTWLLYQNALSEEVVVEDILKYAKKSMKSSENEKNVDLEEQIAELRRIVNAQQEIIASQNYGSTSSRQTMFRRNESTDAINLMNQEDIAIDGSGESAYSIPIKKVLSTSAMDVWGSMAMGVDDDANIDSQALGTRKSTTTNISIPVTSSSSDFSFKSPDVMPPR